MARPFILCWLPNFISFIKLGRIRQTIAYARISSYELQIYLLTITIFSSFSHSSSFQWLERGRILEIREQTVFSLAIQQFRAETILLSIRITSSFEMTLLACAANVVIFGGQISFIFAAIRRTVMAIFSQLSSLRKKGLLLSWQRQEIARYWVSLPIFLVKDRIHLIDNFLYSSSVGSRELEEELLVSVKLGIEVAFLSIFNEVQLLTCWNLTCIFYFFKFLIQKTLLKISMRLRISSLHGSFSIYFISFEMNV